MVALPWHTGTALVRSKNKSRAISKLPFELSHSTILQSTENAFSQVNQARGVRSGRRLTKHRLSVDAFERDSLLPRSDGTKALQSGMLLIVYRPEGLTHRTRL